MSLTMRKYVFCNRIIRNASKPSFQARSLSFMQSFEDRFYKKIEVQKQTELSTVKKFGVIVRSLDKAAENERKEDFCNWLKKQEIESEADPQKVQAFLQEVQDWLTSRTAQEEHCFSQLRGDSSTWGGGSEKDTRTAARHALCAAYLGILRSEIAFLPETLTVSDYAEALKLCMTGSTDQRLQVQFKLYDKKGKGMLDEEASSQAVNSLFATNQQALLTLYPKIDCLTKKQKKPFPKIVEGYLLDKLQVPMRMRCVFAWAEKVVPEGGDAAIPGEMCVTYEEYLKCCKEFFPEYQNLTNLIMDDVEHERNEAYEKRKRRKMAFLKGTIFLTFIGFAEAFVKSL